MPERLPQLPTPDIPTNTFNEFTIPFRLEYMKNSKFTGRKELLNEVHWQLSGIWRDSQPNILALFGPGGIGKTQIAIEYAYLHNLNYSSVFWIDATNQNSAFDSFLQIAKRVLTCIHGATTHTGQPPNQNMTTNINIRCISTKNQLNLMK
jgi:Cdc6-like AAA superfamily ATPase